MKLETIIVLIIFSIAFGAKAEVRQVRPNLHLLPPIKETPATIAERVELKAKRAALAERQAALLELAEIAGEGKATTTAEILKQVEQIKAKSKKLKEEKNNGKAR